ncbi:MAG: glycosyltransferase family 4 protein [Candidatus Kapabacteria bacterium]|nr:glycosyltransferase family 4 protein [Candidatus Kapabacteria bacterium]
MKILIFNWQDIKNPFGGGAEVHLHEIFSRIAKMDNEVWLYCCKTPELEYFEEIDGIKIFRNGNRNTFNFTVKSAYLNKFRKEKFDIVIDDINKIPFYTPLYVKEPLLAISHHFFGKSIFREANPISASYVYFSEKLMDFVYKKTQFAVVSQSTMDEFISRGYDPKNFSIVQNAITQEKFPMKVANKSEFPTIAYFGRLKKYKSIDHLLFAFAKVDKIFPNARLHILGKGDFMPSLQKLAVELNIYDKTKFFGYVSEAEKIELLSSAWVVVNTSMKEGWGITNIEANACGTPVISANVPGLKDSVSEGISGLLYDYGNINQLTEKLEAILSNQQLRNNLSEGSIQWASLFSWDNSAKLMLERCKEVIELYHKRK